MWACGCVRGGGTVFGDSLANSAILSPSPRVVYTVIHIVFQYIYISYVYCEIVEVGGV